jgi:hypothetical protein
MEGKAQKSTTKISDSTNISQNINNIEPPKLTEEDEKILKSFQILNPNIDDLITFVNDLSLFNHELKSFKNISFFINSENLDILKKINAKDNIKINLILSKIYNNIISNESLYSQYLIEITEEKINLIMQIIDECIILIQKLQGFVFDPELFKFKEKTLSLIKCIYFNCKSKITNAAIIQKLEELLESFPTQFYSETYNELNKDKDLYDILRSKDVDKINNFEDKFAQINSYYEQFEAFKKFVECNSGVTIYSKIGDFGEELVNTKENIDLEQLDFYQNYGMLLLKFCKYHQYIFLNKEEKEEENKNKDEENDADNIRVVFLLDKIKQNVNEEKKENEIEEKKENSENGQNEQNISNKNKGNKKIIDIMNQKSFVSMVESKEYNELIKKEINKYLEITKEYANDPKLKTVIEQMNYFLSILDVESYVPLYLSDFSKITISDNFTPSFLTNVPAGKTNQFYLETKTNETMLVFIEFNLEDKSKDISFEVNKYEIYSNEFKNIFKEEKIEDTFKFFILCSGYSLYQIIFDNYYSWFTSKDVNYRFGLLRLLDKPMKSLDNGEDNEDERDDNEEYIDNNNDKNKFYCKINDKNIGFNIEKIYEKIKICSEKKDENIIYIPVILYLNTLRIISFTEGENEDNQISIKEYIDEEEELITKSFFEYKTKHYLSKILKLKSSDCTNKKIILSIYSQNRDLSDLNEEIAEKIKSLISSKKDNNHINYLKKIGFYPEEEIEGYKLDIKLYDLCEQSLIYHIIKTKSENKEITKPILFMIFDEKVVNASIFNKNSVLSELTDKKNYLSNVDISDENKVFEFLENINETMKGIELVLSLVDYKDKKKIEELIEKIKKFCEEKLKVNIVVYNENDMGKNVFKYMNLFYGDKIKLI